LGDARSQSFNVEMLEEPFARFNHHAAAGEFAKLPTRRKK
jgi:hypothetical protein